MELHEHLTFTQRIRQGEASGSRGFFFFSARGFPVLSSRPGLRDRSRRQWRRAADLCEGSRL